MEASKLKGFAGTARRNSEARDARFHRPPSVLGARLGRVSLSVDYDLERHHRDYEPPYQPDSRRPDSELPSVVLRAGVTDHYVNGLISGIASRSRHGTVGSAPS